MKKTLKFLLLAVAAMALVFTTSCKKPKGDEPHNHEDGVYLVGPASPFSDIELNGMLKPTPNENGSGPADAEIYEIYAYMSAGAFELREVAGQTITTIGGTLAHTSDGSGAGETPRVPSLYYTPTTNGTITIATAGFYHIVYSPTAKVIVVTEAKWGLRGELNGWGFTELTGSGNKEEYTFKLTNVEVPAGPFKFAYSHGWKLGLNNYNADDATIRVNTNLGPGVNNTGTLTFNGNVGTMANLAPGGMDNFMITNTTRGVYTFELKWTKANGFTNATMTKTGDLDAPDFPETVFIVGGGTPAGWTPENGIPMHPTGIPGQFWAIVYLGGGDGLINFLPTNTGWTGQFGSPGNPSGIGEFELGKGNITVPAGNGYYMVVVDHQREKIAIAEAKIYGMGNAFGGWNEATYAFTMDNTAKTFTSPAAVAPPANQEPNLRSYAFHPWIPAWWRSEINVVGTNIVYRGAGGDPAAFPLAVGKRVVYNIDAGTATVQ